MKIKHWAGYGTVNAKKLLSRTYDMFQGGSKYGKARQIMVEVTGNHEYGLTRPCYDLDWMQGWLGKRFAKDLELASYNVLDAGWQRVNGTDEDCVVYELIYKEEQ